MGKLYVRPGGGGGADLDALGSTAAAPADVLSQKTFYGSGSEEPQTGTMKDKSGAELETTVEMDSTNSQIKLAVPVEGKYSITSKLITTFTNLASLIGLVASKIMSGNTILNIEGTATSDGTATAAQILKDKIAYVKGAKVTGSMTNNGAVSQTLDAGGSYTVPAGYHNGSGKITAKTLADLTAAGDATAAQILTGKKAYVDGNLITGTMANRGAATKTITPSTATQTYSIAAGYHNGSGKVTVSAIPSNYINISGGLTFFDSGTFGAMVTNLGLGKKRPHQSISNGDGSYTVSIWTGDESAIDPTSMLSSKGYFQVATADGSIWCTRKTINFDNIKSMNFTVWSGSGSMRAWFYNLDTQKAYLKDFASGTSTIDISDVTGNCIFGIQRVGSGGREFKKIWFE